MVGARSLCVLCALALFGSSAAAQEIVPPAAPTAPVPVAPPPAAAEVRATRTTSITISPVHLLPVPRRTPGGVTLQLMMLEVTAEFRAHPRVGVAAIGAVGRLTFDDGVDESNLVAYEVGAQANGYVIGGFDARHSLQVGVELLYVVLSGEIQASGVFADGTSVGPYVGYKFIANGGFTFLVQFGMAYLAIRAESGGASEEGKRTSPLLNLNLGWSF